MAPARSKSKPAASKSSPRRRGKPVLAKKRRFLHAATQKAICRLSNIDEVVNSQGRQRGGASQDDDKSTTRCRGSRKYARKHRITPQRHAMKRASADHRAKCPVAPGSAAALAKLQAPRSAHKVQSLRSFLLRKSFAARIFSLENCKCWYLPHGKRKCEKIPKGFIIKVECKRRQPSVLKHASEAWVTLYPDENKRSVYCVDARNVFVTKGSLKRRGMVGERARCTLQSARVERKKQAHKKKPRLLKTRS